MENLEDKMKIIIEDVMNKKMKEHEKMFKSHQEIIKKLISDNNIIINQRLDNISKELNKVKTSIQVTDNNLLKHAEEIKKLNAKSKTIKTNEETLKTLISRTEIIQNKITDLENRSRRNNLRIDGLLESQNETWADCEAKVQDLIKRKLKIKDDIKIERAHRTGKIAHGKPRTILFKLHSYKDKTTILRSAKRLSGTGIFINEDYAKETVEKRKQLWEEVKKLRREGKYAVLQFDKIIVKNNKPKE